MYDIFYIHSEPIGFPSAKQVRDIDEARNLSTTRFCWVLNGRNNYRHFDILWEPYPWESHYIHVWPCQHQINGGTYLIPKNTEHVVDGTDHDNLLTCEDMIVNYHKTIVRRDDFSKIICLNHGPSNNLALPWYPAADIATAHFINDYLSTLKRVLKKYKDEEFVWITSSLCDYTDFDFTWHPSEWQKDMLHVFPSNEQKFGDTFCINVKSFLKKSKNLELLEWFETISFRSKIVPRYRPQTFHHHYDNQPEAVASVLFRQIKDPDSFTDPIIMFSNRPPGTPDETIPTVNLWRPETRAITPLDKGATTVLIPREAYTSQLTELYDFPYIDETSNDTFQCRPLDIVFMSNGEDCAEDNYINLMTCTSSLPMKKRWVSGIKGRVASARAAAEKSSTDWFFSVNAKLKVSGDFDWNWQPDRMQAKKHYIFYAHNPITNETYGHMAMIAWNKELIMTDTEWGLDFTMSHPHEVVPILSGEAIYGPSPWDLWRTAFREVVKLSHSNCSDSQARIDAWESTEKTCHWTYRGTRDGLFFYYLCECYGMDKLKLTFEWDWLWKYFNSTYPDLSGSLL